MGYEDKILQCVECGMEFTFTSSEQEFFESKGFVNEPKRCPSCRRARKLQRDGDGDGYGRRREMYPAVCASCGKEAMVPFEPREGRPVYCSECFAKMKQESTVY